MSDHLNILDFIEPVQLDVISEDVGYKNGQIGKQILVYDGSTDISQADIVIIGCSEQRGRSLYDSDKIPADEIRKEFYSLFYWHPDVKIADLGNVVTGSGLSDSYAALKTIIKELIDDNKLVVILGGSHDLTTAQYQAYADRNEMIEAVCIDALIDIDIDSIYKNDNFLMEMLTGEPNFIKNYNHIAFQSYYIHPHMLETMDKLRFDCFRVGHVKDNIEEMEPVIRNSSLFSFDVSAIANSFAPSNKLTPNGLNGEEACVLTRFAGMSPNITSVGIYGYLPDEDVNNLTAKQISHMLWYLIDGRSHGKRESALEEKSNFYEFHIAFAEIDTIFLKSKKTGRWWMQLPDKSFIACSNNDYRLASTNEIPERWYRSQERG